jgi:L-asparaginase II
MPVVNRNGKLLTQVGDPHWSTYTHSNLKVLQALPFSTPKVTNAQVEEICLILQLSQKSS